MYIFPACWLLATMRVSFILAAVVCVFCKVAASKDPLVDCKESDFAAIAETLNGLQYDSSQPKLGLTPQEWKKCRTPPAVNKKKTKGGKHWLLFTLLKKQNELKQQCSNPQNPTDFVSLTTAQTIANEVIDLGIKGGEIAKENRNSNKEDANRSRQGAVSLHILASMSDETILAARYLLNRLNSDKKVESSRSMIRTDENSNSEACQYPIEESNSDLSVFGETVDVSGQERNYLVPLYIFLLRRYSCIQDVDFEIVKGLMAPLSETDMSSAYVKALIHQEEEATQAGRSPPSEGEQPGLNPGPQAIVDPSDDKDVLRSYADPMVEVEILFRLESFLKNLNVYFAKLGLAGITAAETAARVQVQASLAELASRAIDQIEKLNLMEASLNKMIAQTFDRIQTYAAPTK